MNILKGTIQSIDSFEGLACVKLKLPSGIFITSVLIENQSTSGYIQPGYTASILFKETEVSLTKNDNIAISIQNKFPCRVQSVVTGKILCQVNLETIGFTLSSIITRHACLQLDIKPGDRLTALIKSNEIILAQP